MQLVTTCPAIQPSVANRRPQRGETTSTCMRIFTRCSVLKASFVFKVSRVVNLSYAVWLLFLDTNTSLEQFFADTNIPFDCQFLVAQPQGDHVVVLTEVYRVSPTLPLQTYRFGNWTAGAGLTWPSQGLYRRRNNLQGTVLRVAVNNVMFTLLFYILSQLMCITLFLISIYLYISRISS